MALDLLHTVDNIEVLENFLEKIRPPIEIRSEIDVSYTIDEQSVIINEVRPVWDQPNDYKEYPVAKATYVKSRGHWKIFWKRADLKWHSYTPEPIVKTLKEFTEVVKEDNYHCFWG